MVEFRSALISVACCFVASVTCPGQKASWYKYYTGMIDKYPVTLHLYKVGHEYHGDYYYNARQELIFFSGEDTSKADSIQLACYLPDQETSEYFIVHLENNDLKGQWITTKTNNSTAYSFSAKEEATIP